MLKAPNRFEHASIDGRKSPHQADLKLVESPYFFDVEKLDTQKLDGIANDIKSEITTLSRGVFSGEISIRDSIQAMVALTNISLESIADIFAKTMDVDKTELPFAFFLFGSAARNLMLPNSDLDIGIVFQKSCPHIVRATLTKIISSLPFEDEIDIAHWDSIDGMKKENCPSMMETNKAVEAKFVAGNISIEQQHTMLIAEQDSKHDKEERFITEYWLLHKFDYGNRSTEHGANLKYDFGASRDIVFLDWYHQINPKIYNGDVPDAFLCLDEIIEEGIITSEEREKMKSDIELILLIKFALFEINRKSKDVKLLYFSESSFDVCYSEISELLKKRGINNVDELLHAYHQSKARLHELVKRLFEAVSSSDRDVYELWKTAKEKKDVDEDLLETFEKPSWFKLVPFAIRSTSPTILKEIVKRIGNLVGFEYILRIISGNKYITDDIRRDLIKSRLDERFKKKIQRQLEKSKQS